MKVLCLCNTYLQLIVALQLKCKVFPYDYFSVFLSDHSSNAEQVIKQIYELKIFDEIEILSTKNIDYSEGISGVIDLLLSSNKKITNKLRKKNYDLYLFYNFSISSSLVFSELYKNNPNIISARFEEGILSYNTRYHSGDFDVLSKKLKALFLIRRYLKKPIITETIKQFYCFYPEHYHGKLETVQIPFISNTDFEFKNILSNIFNIKEENLLYPQKYIYFASVGDFEGGKPIGELQLVKKIASVVGMENLLIKVHPRDTTNSFEKHGFIVDKASAVPWEVIQLNYNFENHVFLTATSGSVLSVNLMLQNAVTTAFLYPLCDLSENPTTKEVVDNLEVFFEQAGDRLKKIHVLKDVNDIIAL